MKNYLILDHEPPASRKLRLALIEMPEMMSINHCTEPAELKEQLASGQVTAVFVRIELWDHRLFEDVLSLNLMPELVLLGKAAQKPAGCCGFGLPHFIADDCSVEDLKKTINYVNSSFMQFMEFKFIMAMDGDKLFKIDIGQINKMEPVTNGSLLHTSCGLFVTAKTVTELEDLKILAKPIL